MDLYKVFKELPTATQLEYILDMHDALTQPCKDSWLQVTLEQPSCSNKVARTMLNSAPEKCYVELATTFMGHLSREEQRETFNKINNFDGATTSITGATKSTPIPPTPTPPLAKSNQTGGMSNEFCYSRDKVTIEDGGAGTDVESEFDDYSDLKKDPSFANFGTIPLYDKKETEAELTGVKISTQVSKSDQHYIGFNMVYVLVSILQYLNIMSGWVFSDTVETDVAKITNRTMTANLKKYNVKYHRIKNKSFEQILLGNSYLGELILFVFKVTRNGAENEEKSIPENWYHFCLFFQSTRVLLTFNQEQTNYKLGNICNIKAAENKFQDYMNNLLNKKIVPVMIPGKKRPRYSQLRKMVFCEALVIKK